MALCVRVVSKAQEQAGLADTGIANEDQLENVIVLLKPRGERAARSASQGQGCRLLQLVKLERKFAGAPLRAVCSLANLRHCAEGIESEKEREVLLLRRDS